MNQLDLSIVPEAIKNRLIDLEQTLKNDNLPRGKRRTLQNQRNKLKAKIRLMQKPNQHSNEMTQLKAK